MGKSTRREFCRKVAVAGTVAAMGGAALSGAAAAAQPAAMPTIRLGGLEVSRLILGSNPFFGFSHGNPQGTPKEMKAYYTPAKVMEILDAAAEQGITAVWTPCYDNWVRIWKDYQEKGGKLKIWIGQPDRLPMEKDLEIAAKNGAKAICIQGERVDEQVRKGNWDVVKGWVEIVKGYKLPVGIASHTATVHLEAEQRQIGLDFYHQTLYRPDNYVPPGLEESLKVIEKLEKPVVAYKVLGAGRILPKDTLPVVFKRLKAKDGICLGAFPNKRDELAENARLTRELSAVA